ncbi:MAG: N-acetyltransferase family protein [Acidimicrobiales bacterium]
MIHVREARAADVGDITRILNALIETTTITWRTDPHPTGEREEWFERQSAAGLPVLVAVDDGVVVGFASYGPFRDNEKWPGYRFTVEHSVHVDESAWGSGVGRRLMDELIVRAAAAGVHVMVGAVDAANAGSVRFHERVGFVEQGRLREVGWKHDRWLDLVFMVRRIDG